MSKVLKKIVNLVSSKEKDILECNYETDFTTVNPHIFGLVGATFGNIGMNLDAVGELAVAGFYIDENIDEERPMLITFVWQRNDVNNDTITAKYSLSATATDGSEVTQWVNAGGGLGDAIVLDACAVSEYEKYELVVAGNDFTGGDVCQARLHMNEAGRDIDVVSISVKYFLKRVFV